MPQELPDHPLVDAWQWSLSRARAAAGLGDDEGRHAGVAEADGALLLSGMDVPQEMLRAMVDHLAFGAEIALAEGRSTGIHGAVVQGFLLGYRYAVTTQDRG